MVRQFSPTDKSVGYYQASLPGRNPVNVIGEDERHRIEEVWNQRFRRSGTARVLVAESAMNVALLNYSLADLGALAEYCYTRQDIANAFGVPIAFLTAESNLANLQAAESQHMKLAIHPGLLRRDQKLKEQLIPRFDPSKRLFLASEDPGQRSSGFFLRRVATIDGSPAF
jgi:hypothetical protein